jgi:hypothetical protein
VGPQAHNDRLRTRKGGQPGYHSGGLFIGQLTAAQLFVTGFLGGVFYLFFSAAEGACLPNVVRKELGCGVGGGGQSAAVGSAVGGFSDLAIRATRQSFASPAA